MPKAIWSGSISFGLVNIPVKLYSAVLDRGVHFHMLHEKDGVRVRQQLVCPFDGERVDRDQVVKGYEVSPDRYVTVTSKELEDLAPEASRMIEILDFVGLDEIDPVYYRHPYYLLPDDKAARAYNLLARSMADAGRVGIGKFVMRDKEYLAAVRPVDGALVLETMHFEDEVVPVAELEEKLPAGDEPAERELKMAGQLIEMLAGPFEPEKYHDEYRESVMDLINTKAEGKEYIMPPAVEEEGEVIDIMSALQKSLERARKSQGQEKAAKKARKPARRRASEAG